MRKNLIKGSESQCGASMISILVAAGLLCLGAFAITRTISASFKTQLSAALISERSLIKKRILVDLHCPSLQKCTAKKFLPIYNVDGRKLVDRRGTKMGRFTVFARCEKDQSIGFRVVAKKNGMFLTDDVGRKLSFRHPQSLLLNAKDVCGPNLGSSMKVVIGSKCQENQGSCSPPVESIGTPNAPTKMCCDDGSDSTKPRCPANFTESGAYWDRDGDWGVNGNWVVLCQS